MSEKQVKYQHGDVLIRPTDDQLDDILAKQRFRMINVSLNGGSNDRIVLAKGEATGHAHAINMSNLPSDVVVTSYGANGWDNVDLLGIKGGDVVLTHEEHKPITLPPGNYEVSIVREFDHLAGRARNVWD
jgi:hypothetical protein